MSGRIRLGVIVAACLFGTLVIVLVFRPQGILGQQTAERV